MRRLASWIAAAALLVGGVAHLVKEVHGLRTELAGHQARETGPDVQGYLLERLRECEADRR